MYKLYKIETDVPEEAVVNEGDVLYVLSVDGALASRFGISITYTEQKENALEFDRKSALQILEEYPHLEMKEIEENEKMV